MYFLRYGNSTSDNQLILDSGKAEKIDVDGHGAGWQKKKNVVAWTVYGPVWLWPGCSFRLGCTKFTPGGGG